MQGASLARIKPLAQILGVPQVQIPHLRPLNRGDAKKLPLWHRETARIARRHQNLIHLFGGFTRRLIQIHRHCGQGLVGVTNHRSHRPARRRIGGDCYILVGHVPFPVFPHTIRQDQRMQAPTCTQFLALNWAWRDWHTIWAPRRRQILPRNRHSASLAPPQIAAIGNCGSMWWSCASTANRQAHPPKGQ